MLYVLDRKRRIKDELKTWFPAALSSMSPYAHFNDSLSVCGWKPLPRELLPDGPKRDALRFTHDCFRLDCGSGLEFWHQIASTPFVRFLT